ncbi:uncharacterized protein SPSK_09624 [Sporothrix schenckii 1099-18]|uniref:ABM domain-containing protein n=2 Tax=Sporothrix schenckii TaxID=29908 RepID=U7Q4I6_SPOS1|nr:uncharacterized protein SPSK_09624 [Sporothrix schenckii 1099-18]ERT02809.1 hypothetical protein HMPREF1624_01111 [Sporothrix schenckii ATCC 58251]KJR84857.1 hypothetical protein SPSK_09624 [Sporothrix schenckii 1099-18]
MSNAYIVEFAVFRGADGATIKNRATAAAKVAGLVAQYGGQKIEDAKESVHVTVWRTADSRKAFAISQQTDAAPLLVEVLGIEEADRGRLTSVLEAPTTEVYTGYDALPSIFAAAVRKFAGLIDAQPDATSTGYRGNAVLETVEDVALAPEAVQAAPELVSWVGPAVKLVVGWTSREAHLEAKEKAGPIKDNIELLRAGHKATNLYHVKLQKLDSSASE